MKAATKRRISAFAVYFALSALLLVKGFSLRHHLIGVGADVVESFAGLPAVVQSVSRPDDHKDPLYCGVVDDCTAPARYLHGGPIYFRRDGGCDLAHDVGLAGIVTIILASPFLLYLVKGMKVVPGQLNDPDFHSADILNFLVPTPVTLPGGALFSSVSDQFTGNISEQDAYIGLPFFLLAVYFSTIAFRSSLLVKRCVLVFWISVLFSLGGVLHAGKNVAHVPLPWHLVDRLPVVSSVLPVRFAMFTSLALAVLCGVFLAQRPTVGRYGVVLCGLLFLFPAPAAQGWEATTSSPFFTEASIKRHFGNDPVLVVLPFGYLGHSMAWQLQSGYAFRQTGGYLGYTPTSEHNDAVLSAFLNNAIPPHFDEQLGFYCVDHHATAIVIGPRTKDILRQAILETHWSAERDGDMIIVRVPPRETLPLFHISGDYWPSPAEVNWMGQQIVVETGVAPARLEMGRPYVVSSPGVSVSTGNIVRHIGFQPGEKTVIDLPANSRTTIRADKVFVPAKEGINTDQRTLSLLIGRR